MYKYLSWGPECAHQSVIHLGAVQSEGQIYKKVVANAQEFMVNNNIFYSKC